MFHCFAFSFGSFVAASCAYIVLHFIITMLYFEYEYNYKNNIYIYIYIYICKV